MNDTNNRSKARPDHAGLFDVAAGQAGYFTTEQGAASVDARRLRMALEDTFASRARQDLPVKLPDPPPDWRAPFANLARELSLPTNVDAGFELAATFLDPILQRPGLHATWSPENAAWEPKGARR